MEGTGIQLESNYVPAAIDLLTAGAHNGKGAVLAGAYIDSAAYPAAPSDSAVQNEIARSIAVNHWTPGINSQFIVLTPNNALGSTAGFCSYHSAFALGHDRSKLVVYGVVPFSGAAAACAATSAFNRTGDPAIDALNVNLSRVRLELTRNPLLNGWYNSAGNDAGPVF